MSGYPSTREAYQDYFNLKRSMNKFEKFCRSSLLQKYTMYQSTVCLHFARTDI